MNNNQNIKNLGLRLAPYLISIASGAIMYYFSHLYFSDQEFSGLLMNISSTLLSVPIMFIFYELVNKICTQNINNSLNKSLIFEVNYIMTDLIKIFQSMCGVDGVVDEERLYSLLSFDKKFIEDNLNLSQDLFKQIAEEKEKLFKLTHGNFNLSVLSDQQIKSLMAIIRNITIIYKEGIAKKKPNNELIVDNIYRTIQSIAKWIYLSEDEDSLIKHHSMNG